MARARPGDADRHPHGVLGAPGEDPLSRAARRRSHGPSRPPHGAPPRRSRWWGRSPEYDEPVHSSIQACGSRRPPPHRRRRRVQDGSTPRRSARAARPSWPTPAQDVRSPGTPPHRPQRLRWRRCAPRSPRARTATRTLGPLDDLRCAVLGGVAARRSGPCAGGGRTQTRRRIEMVRQMIRLPSWS